MSLIFLYEVLNIEVLQKFSIGNNSIQATPPDMTTRKKSVETFFLVFLNKWKLVSIFSQIF